MREKNENAPVINLITGAFLFLAAPIAVLVFLLLFPERKINEWPVKI
jgi:hypothetical protein